MSEISIDPRRVNPMNEWIHPWIHLCVRRVYGTVPKSKEAPNPSGRGWVSVTGGSEKSMNKVRRHVGRLPSRSSRVRGWQPTLPCVAREGHDSNNTTANSMSERGLSGGSFKVQGGSCHGGEISLKGEQFPFFHRSEDGQVPKRDAKSPDTTSRKK